MRYIREWEMTTERNGKIDTVLFMIAAVLAAASVVGLMVELLI